MSETPDLSQLSYKVIEGKPLTLKPLLQTRSKNLDFSDMACVCTDHLCFPIRIVKSVVFGIRAARNLLSSSVIEQFSQSEYICLRIEEIIICSHCVLRKNKVEVEDYKGWEK